MTILMTFLGVVVFLLSLKTADFKVALKRMWMLSLTGLAIDLSIVVLATTVTIANF